MKDKEERNIYLMITGGFLFLLGVLFTVEYKQCSDYSEVSGLETEFYFVGSNCYVNIDNTHILLEDIPVMLRRDNESSLR